jgi:hypothetical protein
VVYFCSAPLVWFYSALDNFTPEPTEHTRDKGPVNVVNVGEDSPVLVNAGTAKVRIEEGEI